MIYEEEIIAKKFYRSLKRKLSKDTENDTQVEGRGVNWVCYASNRNRKCKINCFSYNTNSYKGPEYLIQYLDDDKTVCHGRNRDSEQAIESILDWISFKSMLKLYDKYYFVDTEKRAMHKLKNRMIEVQPKLNAAEFVLYSSYDDIYELELLKDDRECLLKGKGITEPLGFYFRVDGSEIFELNYESDDFFEIVKMWIVDKSMPSEIKNKFEYLQLGRIAKFYDNGEVIEGDFYNSWDKLERFFYFIFDQNFPLQYSIKTFIKSMRKDGLDELFRAGQSMSILILSKSRRHGFNETDPRMEFEFSNEHIKISFVNQNKVVKFKTFEKVYNKDIKSFIMELDKYKVS